MPVSRRPRNLAALQFVRARGRLHPPRAMAAAGAIHALRAELTTLIATLPETLRSCRAETLANDVAPIFEADDYDRCARDIQDEATRTRARDFLRSARGVDRRPRGF